MSRGRILIVDDKPAMSALLVDDLEELGYTAEAANSAEEALARAGEQRFDVVVTDLRMPGGSGIQLCRDLIQDQPEIPVIVMTAFGSMDAAIEAMRAGAYDFLTKPFERSTLQLVLDRALNHRRMRSELRRLRDASETREFEGMHGLHPKMQRLYQLIEHLAPTEAPILLRGESGTGKELIARALHRRSLRADGPFIALNCAALPEQLLESELFGHEKGAFTGAGERRLGLMRQAHRGTLFLDEIGDMALSLQPKLLRALQEGKVRPLGSDREHAVDIRVIAASHQDLEAAVREQRFRADLFFRLAVMRVEVPALRERGDDVLLLADHFLEELADRRGLPRPPELDEAAEAALRSYDWPGNVRELRNWMEHAFALSGGVRISAEDLPRPLTLTPEPVAEPAKPAAALPDASAVVASGSDFPGPNTGPGEVATEEELEGFEPLAEVEHRYITRVLDAVGGNKTRAAKILGIDRKTLLARLQRYASS
ncbi:sigma-54-dependent Fis family transcriptional regulator [Pseudenhygromyxa sp. WMMC2535]|uniref:sigma-54-dependent transcriptional regulator n=1 Tax=Pseudenhygromyxa sp. WMMC2535 TaxID=2712867 RepID=UPI0015541D5B|nr:sigma-54 dependent transcriptional regulator [Pseudenhygromyxa sp. WMMC2535]NVB40489.1 sigma-54-dependent Fis family transcriptional regulator [Pseudenhygromyxa sp. WMMC2535]